jgi:hypothetical protein
LYGYVGNDPTNGIDSTGLFLDSSEAAIGLLILTAALAAPEIANAPAPCDDTYPSQGPVPLILGIASVGAGQSLVGDVVAPTLGNLLGRWIGRGTPAIEGIYDFTAASGKTYVGQSGNIAARLNP